MRLTPILFAFLSVLLLAGCAGFFERELELVELPYERQLVLNTVLSPQDSLIRADVYVTAPAIGELPPDYPRDGRVDDARVRLVGPTGTFSLESRKLPDADPTYVLPQTEAQLESGETYEVIAEWDGLTARGQVTIPELKIPRDSIVLDLRDGGYDLYLNVTWPNQTGEDDYYLVFSDEEQYAGPGRTRIQRNLIDYLYGRDALGNYVTSRQTSVSRGSRPTINVCQTTQATYDYLVTRQTLQVNDENPFAEPTTVANNLQEGLGLVGASNCWQFSY